MYPQVQPPLAQLHATPFIAALQLPPCTSHTSPIVQCNCPQEMNGAVDEAEVRRAAQLFSDLSRVVSAKQLGPMLRTQVLLRVLRVRGPGFKEDWSR